MAEEFETGAMTAAGDLKRAGEESDRTPSRCLNCDTPLQGRFCHACGQIDDDFQRPFWKLLSEGASDLFALDSRIARTLPTLLFRPGRVTRNYIDGKRSRYVPPFRLYLLVSLLFFLVFFTVGATGDDIARLVEAGKASNDVENALLQVEEEILETHSVDPAKAEATATGPDEDADKETPTDDDVSLDLLGGKGSAFTRKIEGNIRDFIDDPRRFWLMVQSWAPRVALFLVPLTVIGLGLAYPFKSGVFIYDHVIAALHFQTFMFIATIIVMLAPPRVQDLASTVYFLGTPIYFYRMLRVIYDSSRWLTLLRTLFLWMASFVVVLLLVFTVFTTVLATA